MTQQSMMVFRCHRLAGEADAVVRLTIVGCAANWRRANEGRTDVPRVNLAKTAPLAACQGCSIGEAHARDGKAAPGVRMTSLAPAAASTSKPKVPAAPERAMPEGPPPAPPPPMTAESVIARAAAITSRYRAAGAQPRYPRQVIDQLVLLVADGHAMKKLAQQTGISVNTIARYCKRMGVKPKRPWETPEEAAERRAATPAPVQAPEGHRQAIRRLQRPDEDPTSHRTIFAIEIGGGREALVSFPPGVVSPLDLAAAGHALVGRSIIESRASARRSQEGSKT